MGKQTTKDIARIIVEMSGHQCKGKINITYHFKNGIKDILLEKKSGTYMLYESSGSRDVEKVKFNVKLDGVSLNRVNSTKFWGVIIDENLTWKITLMQFQRLSQEILEC